MMKSMWRQHGEAAWGGSCSKFNTVQMEKYIEDVGHAVFDVLEEMETKGDKIAEQKVYTCGEQTYVKFVKNPSWLMCH